MAGPRDRLIGSVKQRIGALIGRRAAPSLSTRVGVSARLPARAGLCAPGTPRAPPRAGRDRVAAWAARVDGSRSGRGERARGRAGSADAGTAAGAPGTEGRSRRASAAARPPRERRQSARRQLRIRRDRRGARDLHAAPAMLLQREDLASSDPDPIAASVPAVRSPRSGSPASRSGWRHPDRNRCLGEPGAVGSRVERLGAQGTARRLSRANELFDAVH